MATTWAPHPRLEAEIRPIIQKAINAIPTTHLLLPKADEVFETPDDAWTRI